MNGSDLVTDIELSKEVLFLRPSGLTKVPLPTLSDFFPDMSFNIIPYKSAVSHVIHFCFVDFFINPRFHPRKAVGNRVC